MKSGSHPVVLCVDDERPTLSALNRLLRNEPYELLITSEPEEALRWAGEREVDVLLTDQRMPGMSGSQLLEAVRLGSPTVATVMLTAFPDSRSITQCTDGVIGRLITKPWNDQALKRAVLDAVRERRNAKSGSRRDTRELIHAINLDRRSPAEILGAVGSFLQFAGTLRSDVLLLLRNLRELEGSIPGFLLRLADTVQASGLKVSLADSSGMARAFVDIEPWLTPLGVYGPGPSPRRSRRVLIVEPVPLNRELLRDLARCEGHAPETAETLSEGLRKLESDPFDVLLLDLPGRDGLTLLKRLVDKPGRPRVVVLSETRNYWDERTCREAGVHRQLSKPYRIEEVLRALREE